MDGVAGGEAGDAREGKRREQSSTPADLLSPLADDLLRRILSFMWTEDAVRTALLSRRWRHLWTSATCLDFGFGSTRRKKYYPPARFVDRALVLHEGAKIQSFRVAANPYEEEREYDHAEFVSMVDSWVRFALRRRAEVLELVLGRWGDQYEEEYRVPGCVFTSVSLVSLTLEYCHLHLPSRISMGSLRTLALRGVTTADFKQVGNLLDGCPSLERLILQDWEVSFKSGIRLEASNSHLQTLELRDDDYVGDDNCGILISIPSVKTLVLYGYVNGYHAKKDLSSIVNASLDFRHSHDLFHIARLLHDLRHVKVLKLSSMCVQFLSRRKYESFGFSSEFGIQSLELTVGFFTSEIPGIFDVLRSFTKLEFLTVDVMWERRPWISFVEYTSESYSDGASESSGDEEPSPTMLRHLKTVSIFGLERAVYAYEGNETTGKILEKYENGIEFIRFLLKNSPTLERLTINTMEQVNKLTKEKTKALLGFASSLLALPRASPNARVVIQD